MKEEIKFYLDAFEMLNKPRRIFMGLGMQADLNEDKHSDEEVELTKKIIREAEKDFYEHTLPKFEEAINNIHYE